MVLMLKKTKAVGKFLWNRMKGVEYGGVKVGNNTLKLVETSTLRKMNNEIWNSLNIDQSRRMIDAKEYQNVASMVENWGLGAMRREVGAIADGYKGQTLIYTNASTVPALNVVEKLRNPISEYLSDSWRSIVGNSF